MAISTDSVDPELVQQTETLGYQIYPKLYDRIWDRQFGIRFSYFCGAGLCSQSY